MNVRIVAAAALAVALGGCASMVPPPYEQTRHCTDDVLVLDRFVDERQLGADLGDAWVARDPDAVAKIGEDRAQQLLRFAYRRDALTTMTPYPDLQWSGTRFRVTNGYDVGVQSIQSQYRAWCRMGRENEVLQ